MWQFLAPSVYVLPPLCSKLKCGAPNHLSHPALAFQGSPGLIITLSFQEKSAFAYSCGWYYLNRDISLARQDISVYCAVGTVWPLKGFSNKDISANGLLEGDWPHLEPACSLAIQHGRPAGLLAVSCSGAMSSRKSKCSSDFYILGEADTSGESHLWLT